MKKAFHIFKKIFIYTIIFVVSLYALLWIWSLFVKETPNKNINFGVTFSELYAKELGLNWKETYIAVLDDLNVERIRIPVY